MNVDDLTLEVRDKNLTRVGAITGTDLNGTFRPALNEAGEWELTLPLRHPMAAHLRRPGSGIILTLDGETVLSGPTTEPKTSWSANTLGGSCTFTGTTDTVHLADRRAYPDPTSGFASIQSKQEDRRTGRPADVMAGFVAANMGDRAPAERRIPGLITVSTSVKDTTITKVGRFQRLSELLREIADPHSLAFDIVQLGAGLVFRVWDIRDRTRDVQLDIDNGQLASAEVMKAPPEVTHIIVAGKGELGNRRILECTTAASVSAGTAWGRRIEDFVDDPATEDETELRQMGTEELAAGAPTGVISKAVPVESTWLRYGTWKVGDLVAVTLEGDKDISLVTGAVIIVGPGGVRIGAQIGEVRRFNRTKADQMARVEKGLSRISRAGSSGSGGGGGGGGGGAKVEYATIAQAPFYTESGLVKIIPEGSKGISDKPVTFMRSYIPAAGDYVVILDGIILGRAISGPYDAGQWSEPIPAVGRMADADVSRWGELTVTKTTAGWVIVTGALLLGQATEGGGESERLFTLPGEMRPLVPDTQILTGFPSTTSSQDRPLTIKANGEVRYNVRDRIGSVLPIAFAFNNNPDGLDTIAASTGRGAWGVDAYGMGYAMGFISQGAVPDKSTRSRPDTRYYSTSSTLEYAVKTVGTIYNRWGWATAPATNGFTLMISGPQPAEEVRYDTLAGPAYTLATPTNAWKTGNIPSGTSKTNSDVPRFVLRPDGITVLAGGVQNGILGQHAFIIPEGMRPKYETVFVWGRVTPAGEVIPAAKDAPFTHSMWIADH